MQKQILTHKLQQTISPLQLQFYGLLELSTVELADRIRKEIEENPALEEEPFGFAEGSDSYAEEGERAEQYAPTEDYSDYDDAYQNDGNESFNSTASGEQNYSFTPKSSLSLHEFLTQQLADRDLSEKEETIALYLIGSLDEDGYLRQSLSSISDDLLFQQDIEANAEEIEEMLSVIQDFDPTGIGARNLQECLLLQLGRKRATPSLSLAYTVIKDFFVEFSNRHFEKIIEKLDLTAEQLQQANHEITQLTPHPANGWEDSPIATTANEITPDFVVEESDGIFSISLNQKELKPLQVSSSFVEMLNDYQNNAANQTSDRRNAIAYTKQKIDSARWFINAMQQRRETLLRVMEAIVNFQKEFFISGNEEDLRPMILNDIAIRSGNSISTISRINNSKYVDTKWGIFPLKFFYMEKRENAQGEEIALHEINALIKEIIENEDKNSPIADDELSKRLAEKGYNIARRTVAKYRENLGIPVARLRREITHT